MGDRTWTADGRRGWCRYSKTIASSIAGREGRESLELGLFRRAGKRLLFRTESAEKQGPVLLQAELNRVVAEILEVPESEVTDLSNLEELGWDSLSNLTFISIADERYRASIDANALAQSETPADLRLLFP